MTPPSIMVVEDEPITAEDLQEALTQMGYTVSAVVSTAGDAIREAERTRPDLVLMDIRIRGEVDGVEAARTIRRRFDIPAVYLTAHADSETLSRAKLAEPLGYIIKPFQEPELKATIEMALHKQKVDRQAKQDQARLSATIGAIGEGVISVDGGGAVTLLNPAAETWTGWKQSEATGADVDRVFPIGPAGGDLIRKVLADGILSELDETSILVGRDGSKRPMEGSVSAIRDHMGQITGAVIVFGERKEPTTVEPFTPGIVGAPANGSEMVVESAVMKQVVQFARRVAASEASTVLIEGESGTGKDLLAKYLHYQSRRRTEPLLVINCAAIPETLLESELFGYEKGAFTDARQQKRGILEMAHNGTVFLDEIGEMPLALQAKLLRVLEEQKFRRLGGLKDIQVDLRVVTATNRDLREAIRQGRFRLDLYYRLNVIQIAIPPLRDRREDVIPLANRFVQVFNQRYRRQIRGVSPAAADLLLLQEWPGNARELRNIVERAMVMEDSDWIQPSSLGLHADSSAASAPEAPPLENMLLQEAERTMLLRALEKTGWNQSEAARVLGISRDTLRYRMKKFNLRQVAETPDETL
jgi:PAS domain S-box-containing protein